MHAIPRRWLPAIEMALDIKLTEMQKDALAKAYPLRGGRGIGKTMVHCIQLALSIGPPINFKRPEIYSDYGDGSIRYARDYYRKMFFDIHTKLKEFGLPVRDIIN